MRFVLLTLITTLILLQSAEAEDPSQAVASDLSEIRAAVEQDTDESAGATRQEFAEAIEKLAQEDPERKKPKQRKFGRSVESPRPDPNGYQNPAQGWGRDLHPSQAPREQMPFGASPRHRHHPRPPTPPEVKLREVAHHMDNLAHELEMSELFEAADTVRETAQHLRELARPKAGT